MDSLRHPGSSALLNDSENVTLAPTPPHLSRMETYVLLEAARSAKGVIDLDHLEGPEEARFTAARRLEGEGFLKLAAPSAYQITRKGRDPRLLAGVALDFVRRKP